MHHRQQPPASLGFALASPSAPIPLRRSAHRISCTTAATRTRCWRGWSSLHGSRLLDSDGHVAASSDIARAQKRRRRPRESSAGRSWRQWREGGRGADGKAGVPAPARGKAGGKVVSLNGSPPPEEEEGARRTLERDIKARGRRRDWRGALHALRSAEGAACARCHTAAVEAMATSGRWKEALALLKDMPRQGVRPDIHTYSAAMRACRAAGRTEEALSLLETMRRSARGERERGSDAESGEEAKLASLRPDAFCFNICIDACAKGRLHEKAKALLGVMRSDGVAPDVVSFNSVINALGMAGLWKEALGVMEEMVMDGGVTPNSVTYASAINACGNSRQLDRALGLLKEARLAGIEVGASAYNAAIAACGHAGSADEALPLLKEMEERRVPRTVITYSLNLFQKMISEGILPNAITYNALIHASAGGGLKPGGGTVSSPVSEERGRIGASGCGEEDPGDEGGVVLGAEPPGGKGLGGVRRWERVMPLIDEMQKAGYQPDLLSFNLALSACARRGDANRTLRLLGDMRRADLLPTTYSFSSAVKSCERAGKADEVLALLGRMKSGGVSRTLVTFNSALLACAKDGRREDSLRILSEMKNEGVSPDGKTFRLVMQACGHAGDPAGALVILRGMAKAGIPPGDRSFASAMEAFALAGDVDTVLSLMK
ncbi:unnamed protein product, partial [Ectocarpus sp. 12 AP-2014]